MSDVYTWNENKWLSSDPWELLAINLFGIIKKKKKNYWTDFVQYIFKLLLNKINEKICYLSDNIAKLDNAIMFVLWVIDKAWNVIKAD